MWSDVGILRTGDGLRRALGTLDELAARLAATGVQDGERATRDIVSRGIYAEMRAGRTTPNGGVYIQMSHLGVDNVRKQFKGMVERCGDCGFDLAGGQVEVVATAHYMMGGGVFRPDCTTDLHGLFAAGEDTGGVHGANRLGGNGVANSTVFGGIAGDSMARWTELNPLWRAPDEAALAASVAAHQAPFAQAAGDLGAIRDSLYECMWSDVGILRTGDGLRRALGTLDELAARLAATGVQDGERAFNLAWHDWINLRNLIAVSQVIAAAALEREDSRGAHFREDFPEPGALESSSYTVARAAHGQLALTREPVHFDRVSPGHTILEDQDAATPA
ncbi:MAG TPA: FAD-binding protein, partial [Telluria sp.]|nr:FAD-binding protein [Telluria sp.]